MLHRQVQFGLWLSRYVATGLLFFLGLRAPGLPRRPYMLLINEDERDVENGRQVAVTWPLFSSLGFFLSAVSQTVAMP